VNHPASQVRSVIVERELPHPPEKVWRALTEGHLLADWLMKNDFQPFVGHKFKFNADWGVIDCEVVTVEPNTSLAYSWAAYGLESTVTWTLISTPTGTRLRMEHVGFRPDQEQAYQGAKGGWQNFVTALEHMLERID
jgi:uncharacterized protein YndB with AHSA1/START domain